MINNEVDKAIPKKVYLLLLPILVIFVGPLTDGLTPLWAFIIAYVSMLAFAGVCTYYLRRAKIYSKIIKVWFTVLITIATFIILQYYSYKLYGPMR